MTKDEIRQLFRKEQVNALEIAKALKEFWSSQNFYKRQPYQTASQPDIIRVAEEIFAS